MGSFISVALLLLEIYAFEVQNIVNFVTKVFLTGIYSMKD